MTSPAHDVLVQALRDDLALLPEILSRVRGIAIPRVLGAMDSAVRLSRPVEVVEDAIALTDHLPPPLQQAQVHAIFGVLSQRMLDRLREDTMHPNTISERPAVRKLRELLEKQGHARGLAEGRSEGRAEARQADLLTIFSERGLPLTVEERTRIEGCMDVELLAEWHRRAITAASVVEALAPSPTPRKPASRPRRARSEATGRAPSGHRSRGSG